MKYSTLRSKTCAPLRCSRMARFVSGVIQLSRPISSSGPHGLFETFSPSLSMIGSYRKSHLPFLGVDRYVRAGDELPVFDTAIGRIGLEICYDLRFPEVTRSLALAGAEIVCLPTNWPMAAAANAELLAPARAFENRIYLLVANRVGRERTAEFCGRSQIVAPDGTRLAETDATSEALLVAEIDVGWAREKSIVPAPGEYEMHLFGHRRPELYGALVEETQSVTT